MTRHHPAAPAGPERTQPPAAGGVPPALKVLLVEDDPAVRLGTSQALELAGFEVVAFTDAETAAREIVADVPAIVVSDVRLPGMDGLSLLSHAKAVDDELAVILITGHGDIAMAV